MTEEQQRIFDAGVAFGRVCERMDLEADFPRPRSVTDAEGQRRLRLIAADEPTAQIFHLPTPTNGNSAA